MNNVEQNVEYDTPVSLLEKEAEIISDPLFGDLRDNTVCKKIPKVQNSKS